MLLCFKVELCTENPELGLNRGQIRRKKRLQKEVAGKNLLLLSLTNYFLMRYQPSLMTKLWHLQCGWSHKSGDQSTLVFEEAVSSSSSRSTSALLSRVSRTKWPSCFKNCCTGQRTSNASSLGYGSTLC
jgi:hypothetical protein